MPQGGGTRKPGPLWAKGTVYVWSTACTPGLLLSIPSSSWPGPSWPWDARAFHLRTPLEETSMETEKPLVNVEEVGLPRSMPVARSPCGSRDPGVRIVHLSHVSALKRDRRRLLPTGGQRFFFVVGFNRSKVSS